MSGIVIHRAKATRSFSVLWLLEELGLAYSSQIVPRDEEGRRPPEYLAVNPTGQVPTLVDGETAITECPAICIHLADRYGQGVFAPRIDEAERGPYLAWMVFSTAQLEPARATRDVYIPIQKGLWGYGWKPLPEVLNLIETSLGGGPFLLGEKLSAADVMIGATLAMGMHTGELPKRPVLSAYVERLAQRPAYERAAKLNWA